MPKPTFLVLLLEFDKMLEIVVTPMGVKAPKAEALDILLAVLVVNLGLLTHIGILFNHFVVDLASICKTMWHLHM